MLNKSPGFLEVNKSSPESYRWVKGTEASFTLPQARDGNAPLVYKIVGDIPNGLEFQRDAVIISGTPTSTFQSTELTLMVRDFDGETDNITIHLETTLGIYDLEQQRSYELLTGQSINQTILSTLEANLVSSVTPSLPTGMELRELELKIGSESSIYILQLLGSPNSSTSLQEYTIRSINLQGEFDYIILEITVEEDTSPNFQSRQYSYNWAQGYTENQRLPIATGGNLPLTYQISATTPLPDGLFHYNLTTSSLDLDIRVGELVSVELPLIANTRGQVVKYIVSDLPTGLSFVDGSITGTPREDGTWHVQYIAGWSPVCAGGETWIDVNSRLAKHGGNQLTEFFTEEIWGWNNFTIGDDWLDWPCNREEYRAKTAIEFFIQVYEPVEGLERSDEQVSTANTDYESDPTTAVNVMSTFPSIPSTTSLLFPANNTNTGQVANSLENPAVTPIVPSTTTTTDPDSTSTTQVAIVTVPTISSSSEKNTVIIQSLSSDISVNSQTSISVTPHVEQQDLVPQLESTLPTERDGFSSSNTSRGSDYSGVDSSRALDFGVLDSMHDVVGPQGVAVELNEEGVDTGFSDVGLSSHRGDISVLAGLGVTRGCDPPDYTRFCPDRLVSRGELASFLVRVLGLEGVSVDLFSDDGGSVHEGSINRLGSVGLVRGCNPPLNDRFCPGRGVSRGELASVVERVLVFRLGSGVVAGGGSVSFTDTAGSVHAAQIEVLGSVGIVRGCDPPLNSRFCPDRLVSREELATFLVRLMERLG